VGGKEWGCGGGGGGCVCGGGGEGCYLSLETRDLTVKMQGTGCTHNYYYYGCGPAGSWDPGCENPDV